MKLKEIKNREDWDRLVIDSGGHPLQLWGWGEVKRSGENWRAYRLWADGYGGAQVLIRRLPKPFNKLAYIPRGPVVIQKKLTQKFLNELAKWTKQQGCLELKIEPAGILSNKIDKVKPTQKFLNKLALSKKIDSKIFDKNGGWRLSRNRILLSHTVILDLGQSEDELLAKMTKKTRQYIHKSSRENIKIRRVTSENDIKKCLAVYKSTAKRADFALHPDKYYMDIAQNLGDSSQIYVAEGGGEVLSFLWNIVTPEVSFELYGGVTDEGQRLRANYTLKWRVIQQCQKFHVKYYDMNGLINDGVSNFKLGFSGNTETDLIPTLDKPLSPLYTIWEGLLPTGKKIFKLFKN
jgi:lipid II:glycine glycyltransferase (peptidoglycan interpeptide bridge formation enzyme)